jgi:Mg-chelatase subunit ChlD
MSLAGINTMKLAATTTVEGGVDRNSEIVLVLDYSLSMADNSKYTRMRDAAMKMIDSLKAAQNGSDLKVGLVPFSAMVRTSMLRGYVTQPSASVVWTGCTQDRYNPYNLGVSTPGDDAATKWGYIDSGGSDKNFNPKYDCAMYGTDKLDIVPLTDDLADVKVKLAQMFPLGNTNIPLGVEFGWNLLDPDDPYQEGAPYSDESTKKFMVLLTDGVETSRGWGSGNTRNVNNANDNLLTLCSNIAAKNITVFAIAYDVTDPKVTKLLKTCAGTNYFEASKSGDEIDTVFKTITQRIKKTTLRLAR